MPAVGDLDGVWCPVPCPLSIGTGAVAGDERDAGMRLQPGGKTAAGAIREEINWAVTLQVDQDRAVGESLVDRPVVNAEHDRCGPRDLRRLPEHAQERVGTDAHP